MRLPHPRAAGMRIHLIAWDNGVGLSRDIALVRDALAGRGHDVRCTRHGNGKLRKLGRPLKVNARTCWWQLRHGDPHSLAHLGIAIGLGGLQHRQGTRLAQLTQGQSRLLAQVGNAVAKQLAKRVQGRNVTQPPQRPRRTQTYLPEVIGKSIYQCRACWGQAHLA